MYFVSKNNKLFAYAIKTRPFYRYIGTGALLSSCICAWLFLVYFNINNVIATYQSEIKQYKDQYANIENAKNSFLHLETDLAHSKSELNKFIPEFSSGHFEQSLLYIINSCTKCGIAMQGCSTDASQDAAWHTSHKISMQLEGNFNNMLQLLKSFTISHQSISLPSFKLERTAENKCVLHAGFNIMELKKI